MISLFHPTTGKDELLAVADSFNTGWLGKGAKVAEFEAAWANHIGATPEQVVSTNSCTEALFTAVKLLGIGPGDEVIIPTVHFIGVAQAVLAAGGKPVFCDVDPRTLNATADFILSKITRRTVAIILNHYGGIACPMAEIRQLLEQCPGIYLVEDAACAPASTYQGQAVGTFGDIGVWSFDAMKVLTTGDGGMMYIRNERLAQLARSVLYLGTDTQSGLGANTERWWEFNVEITGARRSVMNDVAAAMGLEQLKRLTDFSYRRETIWNFYGMSLDKLPLDLPPEYDNKPSFYFYWIQTPCRDELATWLKSQGIYTSFRYWPLHLAFRTGDCLPNAEKAARETLLLPLHCRLTDEDVFFVCDKIKEFYANQ